jgi:hypothetical protein
VVAVMPWRSLLAAVTCQLSRESSVLVKLLLREELSRVVSCHEFVSQPFVLAALGVRRELWEIEIFVVVGWDGGQRLVHVVVVVVIVVVVGRELRHELLLQLEFCGVLFAHSPLAFFPRSLFRSVSWRKQQ